MRQVFSASEPDSESDPQLRGWYALHPSVLYCLKTHVRVAFSYDAAQLTPGVEFVLARVQSLG